MLDDLDRPLGLDGKQPGTPGRKPLHAIAVVLAAVVVLAGWFLLQRAPQESGGEPEARAHIEPLPPAPPAPATPAAQPQVQAQPANPEADSGSNVQIENGVRVVRGSRGPGPSIIRVDPQGGGALAPAPDARLVEKSRFGLLPRRGKDGATPAQVYARPAPAATSAPRIAIVIGGMGLNDLSTQNVISRLPPAVTLAFAPYGARVEQLAAAAREAGHEILLQAPLEPFDAADAPGPHVIPTGDAPKAEDELHWQMGRFTGYVGLINYLGGKFTADHESVSALMGELFARGLVYIDDGSAPQSLAGAVAGEKAVDYLKVDVRIDETRKPEAIDAALLKLESLARHKGVAVGFASGLTMTNERLASALNDFTRRGVVLIPVSAALRGDRK